MRKDSFALAQIGVSSRDRKGNAIIPDPIIECPVQFSGGGGWSFDNKLVAGDEGWLSSGNAA